MEILWTIVAVLYGVGMFWAWQVERDIGTMPVARVFLIADLVILLLCIVAGAAITWYVARPKPVVETPAAAEKQSDGSIVLERTATQPTAAPKMELPKGGKLERTVSVTVQPEAHFKMPTPGQAAIEQCPPVSVDLALVRMPDQSRRVVASSKDGDVIAGLDVPVDTPALDEPKPWAAGLSYDPIKETPGVWVERDLWRVRLGLEVAQTRQQIGGPAAVETRLRVGFTF